MLVYRRVQHPFFGSNDLPLARPVFLPPVASTWCLGILWSSRRVMGICAYEATSRGGIIHCFRGTIRSIRIFFGHVSHVGLELNGAPIAMATPPLAGLDLSQVRYPQTQP